jgi:hypothetical protein
MEEVKRSPINCSFCGKNQTEVGKVIAGPNVYICDECVGLCQDIVEEEIKLNWEYCECGCKGHDVSVGSLHLWQFDDLKNGPKSHRLHEGHGWMSPLIGSYASGEDADKAAIERVKEELKKIRKATGRE